MLVFLHLSDLHFSDRPRTSLFELDEQLRHEIELDAPQQVSSLGGLSGILITGDIAFSGQEDQFRNARSWLTELAARLGVGAENIWLVPGNHDVDRTVHQNDQVAKSLRDLLRSVNVNKIDGQLDRLLNDATTSSLLYAPLENFMSFARYYGCRTSANEVVWDAPFELGGGYKLVVRGLNSALISDSDDKEIPPQLVVGSLQTQLLRNPGIVYLTMCHHPPAWLRDREQLINSFKNNAAIQLTGHIHKFAVDIREQSISIAAGAAHPQRYEGGWEPRYNLITINLNQSGPASLEVHVYPRVWEVNDNRFVSDPAGPFTASIALDPVTELAVDTSAEAGLGESVNDPAIRYTIPLPVQTAERLADAQRRLVWRIASLRSGYRQSAAKAIGLNPALISRMPIEAAIFTMIEHARESRMLTDLWDAVEIGHGVDPNPNPYREEGL
jgi:predicted phosphodiesterase